MNPFVAAIEAFPPVNVHVAFPLVPAGCCDVQMLFVVLDSDGPIETVIGLTIFYLSK